MTSVRKITANRGNAKASTGPKTALGKSRAAQNARRHGLSVSAFSNSVRSADLENLALEIAGKGANAEVLELARRIAEARMDLERVRQARHDLLSSELTETLFESKRTNKLSLILSDLTRQMVAMDRYERRALSRQKFAIRALDALRRQAALTKRIEDPAPKARTCK